MTHRVFPHIPAGVPLKDADSSHAASGSFSQATEEPPGQRGQDNDIKNNSNEIQIKNKQTDTLSNTTQNKQDKTSNKKWNYKAM